MKNLTEIVTDFSIGTEEISTHGDRIYDAFVWDGKIKIVLEVKFTKKVTRWITKIKKGDSISGNEIRFVGDFFDAAVGSRVYVFLLDKCDKV